MRWRSLRPAGRRSRAGPFERTLKVWDLASGGLERTLEGHSNWVTAVAITPDGRQAVSASHDKTLKVWDLASGVLERTLEGHSNWVNAVVITPDGAASGLRLLWRDAEGVGLGERRLGTHPGRSLKRGRCGGDHSGRAAGGLGLLGPYAEGVGPTSGGLELTPEGHSGTVTAVGITPDLRQAVSASRDRTLKVWDLVAPAWSAPWTATPTGSTRW